MVHRKKCVSHSYVTGKREGNDADAEMEVYTTSIEGQEKLTTRNFESSNEL